MEDKLILGGKEFKSRFILGSGKYNLNLINAAVEQGGAEIITLALRRANTKESENILDYIYEVELDFRWGFGCIAISYASAGEGCTD